MKIKVLASILGLAAVSLSSCATAPQAAAPVPQRTQAAFTAAKDKVWPLIVAELASKYPVQAIEKESGLITTAFVIMPAGYNNMAAGQWIFPPGGFLATWGGLRMNMQILVVETEPGTTLVTINCHYEAFESNVQKTWLVAQSNGSLENGILTQVAAKLPKPVAMTP